MAEYIDRDDAVAVIEEKQKELCPVGMFSRHAVYGTDREKFDAWEEIIEQIERIPAADVRPVRRGTWTDAAIAADNLYGTHGMLYQIRGYVCNCCHEFSLARFNFCPNCGADMRPASMSGANGEES